MLRVWFATYAAPSGRPSSSRRTEAVQSESRADVSRFVGKTGSRRFRGAELRRGNTGAPKRLLILSQVSPPDPAAVGQQLHRVGRAMTKRGWDVQVLTSGRGFADPTVRYAAAETLDGVQVRRLAWGSLGKETLGARAIGGALFLIQAVVRGLITSRPKAILITTSPPMAPIAGLLLARLRRAPLTLWLMDLNPDQAIMTGVVKPGSISARLLELANRTSARATDALVVLDSFMADRIDERWNIGKRLIILPPLALTEDI